MPRYIDADALMEQMENACMGVMSGCDPFNEPLKVLESAPTTDVVPVVRCNECWKRGDEDYCPLVHDNCYPPTLPDDWFCADGERREDVEETD